MLIKYGKRISWIVWEVEVVLNLDIKLEISKQSVECIARFFLDEKKIYEQT